MELLISCPHCGSRFEVKESNHSHKRDTVELNLGSSETSAPRGLRKYFLDTNVYTCPDQACGLSSIKVSIRTAFQEPRGDASSATQVFRRLIKEWQLVPPPKPQMRTWPDSVPQAVRADYTEACLIIKLSPKAAAALARRCLQGMIRDRYGISMDKLVQEIRALKGKVDEVTWKAIDALREIGNVGAHPERDPEIIIDINDGDAARLLQFVERLINEWYIVRSQKEELPNAIVHLASEIKRLKERENEPSGN